MRSLIDTSAIVALLDARDKWHQEVVSAFRSEPLPMVTSAAVLAEVFHLLAKHEWDAAWRFLSSGAVTLQPITDADRVDLQRPMAKYADLPMDFADATLVRLAERTALSRILTLDSDFLVHRIGTRKTFKVFPAR